MVADEYAEILLKITLIARWKKRRKNANKAPLTRGLNFMGMFKYLVSVEKVLLRRKLKIL